MKTTMTPNFTRSHHNIDADGQILGKIAVEIANRLRGKDKPYFVDHLDVGDYVNILNPDKVAFSGRKLEQKVYRRHSGYLGSMKETLLKDKMRTNPEEVFRHAVSGMLPKNRLSKNWLKRLTFDQTPKTEETK